MVAKNHTLNVNKHCAACGSMFSPKGEHRNRVAKYCSKSCWSKRNGVAICGHCKTEISPWKKYCGLSCRNAAYLGRKASPETIAKMSQSKKGYMPVNVFQSGEKHPHWKTDRSQVNRRWWPEYKGWRLKVLARDNYTCQICGIRSIKGQRIVFDVDHIKSWAKHPDLRFELSNGRTLCRPCHKLTPSWMNRWEDFTGESAKLLTA